MVLSTTKRTASMKSLINQPSGGGSKKAGFPYIIGRTSAAGSLFIMNQTHARLEMPMTVKVNYNLPLDLGRGIRMR
jgi:hypothetical protein